MKMLIFITLFIPGLLWAQSIETLQKQIDDLLTGQDISQINRSLNKICRKTPEENKKGIIYQLSSGLSLENFAEVIPGVYRFSVQTRQLLDEMYQTGLCQKVITLNGDCIVGQFDKGDYQQTLQALMSYGFEKRKAQSMIAFYRDHKDVCQSSERNSWHQWLEVYSATSSISEIFKALDMVREARVLGESVCFHCHAGKHRTGLLAMLIKILDGEELTEIYHDYTLHTWNGICISKEEVKEIVPLIIQSDEFLKIRSQWIK